MVGRCFCGSLRGCVWIGLNISKVERGRWLDNEALPVLPSQSILFDMLQVPYSSNPYSEGTLLANPTVPLSPNFQSEGVIFAVQYETSYKANLRIPY